MTINLSDVGKAALAAEGTVLVTGGPGSGKTTLALLKAQRLIPALEPGQKILLLSFSRAAVRQVLIRCKDILSSAERQRIAVKTYHAFCMEIIKSHGRLLNGKRPGILFPGPERLAKSRFDGDWTAEIRRLAAEEGQYRASTPSRRSPLTPPTSWRSQPACVNLSLARTPTSSSTSFRTLTMLNGHWSNSSRSAAPS